MVNDKKHKKKSGAKSGNPTSALLTENEPKMAVREHVENEEKYTRGKDIDYKASCEEKDYILHKARLTHLDFTLFMIYNLEHQRTAAEEQDPQTRRSSSRCCSSGRPC
jgi:hypothetical protein